MKTRLQDNLCYKNILVVVIAILPLLRNGNCSTDECLSGPSLGDTRRTITEDPGTCGGLCDNYINEDTWYRLDASNSGARMPESFVEVWHCGTYIPIWLNGAHPTADNPGPVTIPVCAQLRVSGPTCEWRNQIMVKRCYDGNEYFVYKLKATPYCDMAYCAGNGINCAKNGSWNDVTNSCTNPPTPSLTANPVLTGPYISDRKQVIDDKRNLFTATKFSMKCTLDYPRKTADDGARYDVIFESNGQVVYRVTLSSTNPPEVVMSETYLVGRVGQTVTCKVNSYWQAQFPTRSPYKRSNPFTFDIYLLYGNVRTTSLTISEGTPVQVKVQTSFMITTPWCFNNQEGSLCYPYYTFLLSSSSLLLSVCTFKIANDTLTSGEIWVSSVPDVPTGGEPGNMAFQTENTVQSQNSIFGSYKSDKYPVTINDPTDWLTCISWGNPHIQAFRQNFFYHVYLVGDFVLLKVPSKNIEIHVRLYSCGTGVTCNCGVIAREGNNVLGINSCGSFTLVERYLYDETNPGGTIRFQGGKTWIITLPSGLIITAYVDGKYMSLTVQANGVDNYEGLCASSYPSQCPDCVCNSDCTTRFGLSESVSLFSYSRENPPPCLPTKPSIVPQCDCINGVSPNRICTSPDPKDLGSPILNKDSCNSTPGRRKRQSNSDSSNPPFDKNSEQSTPTLKWPTDGGITEQDAIVACNSSMLTSKVYTLCVTQLKVNVTPVFEMCMLDIQILDDKKFPPLFLPSQMELLCKILIDKADRDTGDSLRQQFLNDVCPRQCSQHGDCKNGQCVCNSDYVGSDCSLPKGLVPQIPTLVSATCDIRETSCSAVYVQAVNVTSQNLVCQFKDDTAQVIYLDDSPSVSGNLVICNVPLVPVFSDLSFNKSVTDYTVYVSISNDHASMKYSNEKKFIIYDGLCVSCSLSSGCSNKTTACNILGRCYASGAEMFCGKNNTDPRVCDPGVSTAKWLPKGSKHESEGSTTCSSSRPTATALIIFFSYLFVKLTKDKYAH